MTPYFADDHLTVYVGDCRAVLATLPAESVHCVVTSPPYWGLRDYGTAAWEGGDAACEHRDPGARALDDRGASTLGGGVATIAAQTAGARASATCRSCGARRVDSQLGLEPTPEEYVASLVGVFREVRRVLRDDGTVWLNLGDSYTSGGRDSFGTFQPDTKQATHPAIKSAKRAPQPTGLKPKDLVGIPWRVAFALQADGWYLRSDIIWAKPNPMPESVTDRPTKSHEYVFLLSKSARYYFDADAVREADMATGGNGTFAGRQGGARSTAASGGHGTAEQYPRGSGRNIRSVWTIATQPYPGAHFATFPRALVEPCVKAGTSERGVCSKCDAPWERVVERIGGKSHAVDKSAAKRAAGLATAFSGYDDGSSAPTFLTTGWRPSCAHDAEPVPAVVLDPFAGSGTTGLVANALSRRAILIDLSADYIDQAMKRNAQAPLGIGA